MKFRKKAVVIEAFKWTGGPDQTEDPIWVIEAIKRGDIWFNAGLMKIRTLEGIHAANPGDFIIQGVKGEIYPCKPDIFAMTYEAVEDLPESKPEPINWLASGGGKSANTSDFKPKAAEPQTWEQKWAYLATLSAVDFGALVLDIRAEIERVREDEKQLVFEWLRIYHSFDSAYAIKENKHREKP